MYRKSYCTVPGVLFGAGVCGGFGVSKINIRVLRLSFQNQHFDYFTHTWYEDRYWSEILFSTIAAPEHDLQIKVTYLGIS